jgi:enterochelin esterase-like enzyme
MSRASSDETTTSALRLSHPDVATRCTNAEARTGDGTRMPPAMQPPAVRPRTVAGLSVRRALAAVALAAVAALAGAELLGSHSRQRARSVPASWTIVEHGARGGTTWEVPSGAVSAVYLPRGASRSRRLRVAYLVSPGGGSRLARTIGLAHLGDQLIWGGTTVPFAVVVVRGKGAIALAAARRFARTQLPVRIRRSAPVVIALGASAPGLRHRELLAALGGMLAPPGAARASAAANHLLPRGFSRIAVGPAGGTIWQGVIPGGRWTGAPRASLIYLPPNIDRRLRYPLVYLLHGIRGAPYSFPGGLGLTAVADHLIARRRIRPFIAVMPPAGDDAGFRGEWTGRWEDYIVRAVVPYAERNLPAIARPRGRAIAGLSAGGYGAVDIALRHPGVFGTVESWSGYFSAPHDGSLAHASPGVLAAHDPSLLVRAQAPALRSGAVRFYLAAGVHDREALPQTRRYARELRRLGLRPTLRVTSGGHTTASWRAGLRDALIFAVGHA